MLWPGGLVSRESVRYLIGRASCGSWSLTQMKNVPEDPEGCNDFERAVLKDLESVQRYLQRLMVNCHDKRLQSRAFHAQANLLTASLLSKLPPFLKTMRQFHDRSGQA